MKRLPVIASITVLIVSGCGLTKGNRPRDELAFSPSPDGGAAASSPRSGLPRGATASPRAAGGGGAAGGGRTTAAPRPGGGGGGAGGGSVRTDPPVPGTTPRPPGVTPPRRLAVKATLNISCMDRGTYGTLTVETAKFAVVGANVVYSGNKAGPDAVDQTNEDGRWVWNFRVGDDAPSGPAKVIVGAGSRDGSEGSAEAPFRVVDDPSSC